MDYVYLLAGEWFWAETPLLISTVLGSCLGVTFYCPTYRQGGMFHCQLPLNPRGINDKENSFRYVDSAFNAVFSFLLNKGIKLSDVKISLYGGSKMFQADDDSQMAIGERNIEKALEILKKENLSLFEKDLRGNCGRRVHFYSQTGLVSVSHSKKECEKKPMTQMKKMLLQENKLKVEKRQRRSLLNKLSVNHEEVE